MRVFKTRWFDRWAAKEELSAHALETAVAEIVQGLIDAQLGGQIVKKRIGIDGRRKSGRIRVGFAFKVEDKALKAQELVEVLYGKT